MNLGDLILALAGLLRNPIVFLIALTIMIVILCIKWLPVT
jgi:hypothetical protein